MKHNKPIEFLEYVNTVHSLHIVSQEAGVFETIIISLQKWTNTRIFDFWSQSFRKLRADWGNLKTFLNSESRNEPESPIEISPWKKKKLENADQCHHVGQEVSAVVRSSSSIDSSYVLKFGGNYSNAEQNLVSNVAGKFWKFYFSINLSNFDLDLPSYGSYTFRFQNANLKLSKWV